MDEGEDPVEFIRELTGQLEPDELERLAGDRRRTARDQPPPFPGRPNPGGTMEPLGGEGTDMRRMRQAADRRRRLGQDATPMSYREERDFEARFPSASKIRLAP